ncbi:effector-associated constant component EACC1 [Actinomadura fulvescens]|uniref:effector-associated constant component EACC1 n=1 Tax=Actinomadura fulvescens TaxID=46160 RepID=UPI00397CA954
MQARISVIDDGGGTSALESLSDWLRGEPELSGRVRMDAQPPRPGEMGALTQALLIAVGSGGTVSVLVTSLTAWLSRPGGAKVRIRIENESGAVVEIETDNVPGDEIETLVRRALRPPVLPRD